MMHVLVCNSWANSFNPEIKYHNEAEAVFLSHFFILVSFSPSDFYRRPKAVLRNSPNRRQFSGDCKSSLGWFWRPALQITRKVKPPSQNRMWGLLVTGTLPLMIEKTLHWQYFNDWKTLHWHYNYRNIYSLIFSFNIYSLFLFI